MDVKRIKSTGSLASRTSATIISHLGDGYYFVPMDSSDDTDMAGTLTVYVNNPSVHLPVWHHFTVIATASSNAMLFATTNFPANMLAISGDTTAADNLEAAFDGTGYATLNNAIRDAVAAKVIETEGSYTLQQALSIILAAVAGVTDDAGATIKTPNGAATRVAATLSSNERTAMTLTPSS